MENFEKPKDNRLGVEEAQELANMQRAEIGVLPEKTDLWAKNWDMGETTAEDYDRALATVEEIKKLAAEEPATEKVLAVLARMTTTARFLAMNAILTGWYPGIEYDERMRQLEDGANRLRKLKEGAKEYEQN